MDAVRLIVTSGRALAAGGEVSQILTEVWQAQALAQAIGSRLAVHGPPELRDEALGLTELAGRGCGVLRTPELAPGELRAAQLTELGDARQALAGLGALLGEVGIALVGIACAMDDESTYWQCMEAIDAADESRDRVREMLRKLADRDAKAPGRSAAPPERRAILPPRPVTSSDRAAPPSGRATAQSGRATAQSGRATAQSDRATASPRREAG